jgi:hypothetical protein
MLRKRKYNRLLTKLGIDALASLFCEAKAITSDAISKINNF